MPRRTGRKGPTVTRAQRDHATAPKVRYIRKPIHQGKSGLLVPINILDVATLYFKFTDEDLVDRVNGLPLIFTRAGIGRFYNGNRILSIAGTDVPRFDHDPVTGEPLGLLFEPDSDNILPQTDNFLDTSWIHQNMEAPVKNVTGPDGVASSAWTVIDNATDSYHAVRQIGVFPTVDNRRANVYVQAGTLRYATFATRVYGSTPSSRVNIFDTQEGVYSHTGNAYLGQTVENLPNGWSRLGITAFDANTAYQDFLMGTSSGPDPLDTSYIGSGGTMHFAFPQAEFDYDSSYVEVPATSPVAHFPDLGSLTDLSWFNPTEGTWFAVVRPLYSPNENLGYLFTATVGGSTLNAHALLLDGQDPTARVSSGGVDSDIDGSGVTSAKDITKIASAYQVDDFVCYAEGIQIGPAISSMDLPVGTIDEFTLGMAQNSLLQFGGHVLEFGFADTRLPNNLLSTVTGG